MQKINKKYHKENSGFALLFSVVLSSILLAVALGVSNIAYRESFFSTSAKESNEAFYAADTAAECVIYYDNFDPANPSVLTSITTTSTYCNNNVFNIISGGTPDTGFDVAFSFNIAKLGSSGNACANIKVSKTFDNAKTRITSVGYNNGGDVLDKCIPTTNAVQRVIEINYTS